MNTSEALLNKKIDEYSEALRLYTGHRFYKRSETMVSFLIVTLQLITFLHLILTPSIISVQSLLALLAAYLFTDFINGLVHMYMDNNTHYASLAGPYIAAFHLHHAKHHYRIRHPLKVYFDESGTKFWLLGYLIVLAIIQWVVVLKPSLHVALVAFGIFSSLAEMSHYWCHNATKKNTIITWLQNHRILLSKAHHKAHHHSDNIQYAFLNGITDPIINVIARHYCKGYKQHADLHTKIHRQRTS